MHDTTTSQDIIEKVEQVLHEYDFFFSKLVCLSTDSEAIMVGIMLLSPSYEKKIKNLHSDLTFAHFYCIFHQMITSNLMCVPIIYTYLSMSSI